MEAELNANGSLPGKAGNFKKSTSGTVYGYTFSIDWKEKYEAIGSWQ